ncbi:MAG: MBOAT family protein, partial [Traorella sp.]
MLLYAACPQRYRYLLLLSVSYGLYWIISKKLTIFIIISTLSIYIIGRILSNIQNTRNQKLQEIEKSKRKEFKNKVNKKQLMIILIGLCFNIGFLFYFKYMTFFLKNINALAQFLNQPIQINILKIIAPIGISFYTLQAISYIIDIYHEKISADKNLGRLALYMCFFPTIMEGPICRYSDTALQLYEGKPITYKNMTYGMQRIIYGLMKKVVVADRLNLFIKTVFTNYEQFDGGIVALGAIFYTCQLYMEFSGTMDVILGSSEIFG